jgi:hypothetical protein
VEFLKRFRARIPWLLEATIIIQLFPGEQAVTFGGVAARIGLGSMKCEELLATLSEYVDGAIEPSLCLEFERHLAGCNPCRVIVDNVRGTIALYRGGTTYELPPEFHERLHAVLRAQWKTGPPAAGLSAPATPNSPGS